MPTLRAGWKKLLIGTFLFGLMTVLCGMPAAAGTATLTWQQPTTYEDGTPLTDLAGYKIYYGTSSGVYSNTIDVGNVLTYQLQSLTDGVNYFFNVTAYNSDRLESGYATEVSKFISASSYPLSVVSAGTGSGAVTSVPAGISCGTACSGTFTAGTSVILTATPNTSSTFTGWSGACSGTGTCSVTMTVVRSVTATFAVRTYTISASAGANGAITPSGAVSVSYGATRAFTITPATGYHVADVLVDGSSVGAVTSYSFTNILAGHSISATFAINTYAVTPSAGANGTISPSVPQTVNQNATTSFTVTPNSGYSIASVTGCGGTLSGTSYTTGPATANCTVTATFAANTTTYTITPSAGANGTISPSVPQTVNQNATTSFTVTPNSGYTIASVTGCGGTLSGTTYTTGPATANCTVTATLAVMTFTISASAGANGAIAPSGAVSVSYGATRAFTITPATGYHVADVLVDGSSVGAVTSYSFTNILAGHSISATFAINTYTVTPSAGANGTISPSVPQTVNRNATTSFTVTPNSGYTIASVTGCGGTLSGTTYTTGPATANCTVTASFTASAPNTLTVNRSGSGSVVSLPAGINCGQICSSGFTGGTAVSLTATPASGWTFSGWTGACTGTGACTVTMNASKTVSALFGDANPPDLTVSSLPDGSVTGNQALNVSGTVKDAGGLQGLVINGSVITVQSDDTFSHLVTLSSGGNTITTVATDLAGNRTTDSRTITLDQAAPGLTITAPADNSTTANSIVNVTGTVSETSTVSIVLNSGTPQAASMSGTAFTATIILRAGLNTITATALDSAGNPSTTVKRTVVYDDQKPAVAITTPPADFTTSQGSVAVQGSVTNGLSASTASISVDGITASLPLDGTGNFSTTAVFAAEGLHTIAVTATNQAGVSTSVQRNVQYTRFGDLNSSGSVDLTDAVLAFRHIMDEQPITDDVIRRRCDVAPLGADGSPHPDGAIDLGDVVIILRRVVGLTNW